MKWAWATWVFFLGVNLWARHEGRPTEAFAVGIGLVFVMIMLCGEIHDRLDRLEGKR